MPDLLEEIAGTLTDAVMRIAELERRLDAMVRHGKVTDVDTKKQIARIEIGERDGDVVKSPWLPYAQVAGDYRFHNPPTKGQQLTLMSPNGELRQGLLLPFTWSDRVKSPSDNPDEHVIAFGKLRITRKKTSLEFKVGGSTLLIEENRISLKSQRIETDGKTELDKGKALVATVAGPAQRVYARV